MQLRFISPEGKAMALNLGSKPALIGRSPKADVVVEDEKVSRFHAEIRNWDDEFIIKDLKSGNGIFVNGAKVTVAVLRRGDTIKIGSVAFSVEDVIQKGSRTVLQELSQEMGSGKGYKTIMREIVKGTQKKPKATERGA